MVKAEASLAAAEADLHTRDRARPFNYFLTSSTKRVFYNKSQSTSCSPRGATDNLCVC